LASDAIGRKKVAYKRERRKKITILIARPKRERKGELQKRKKGSGSYCFTRPRGKAGRPNVRKRGKKESGGFTPQLRVRELYGAGGKERRHPATRKRERGGAYYSNSKVFLSGAEKGEKRRARFKCDKKKKKGSDDVFAQRFPAFYNDLPAAEEKEKGEKTKCPSPEERKKKGKETLLPLHDGHRCCCVVRTEEKKKKGERMDCGSKKGGKKKRKHQAMQPPGAVSADRPVRKGKREKESEKGKCKLKKKKEKKKKTSIHPIADSIRGGREERKKRGEGKRGADDPRRRRKKEKRKKNQSSISLNNHNG